MESSRTGLTAQQTAPYKITAQHTDEGIENERI